MKRNVTLTIIISALALCLALCSCQKDNGGDTPVTTSSSTTATADTTADTSKTAHSTTAVIKDKSSVSDPKKAKALEKDIKSQVGVNENDGITVEDNGNFVYQNVRDASIIYSEERSDTAEKVARNTAKKIAETLEEYYGALTTEDENIIDVGDGDNGIDSVSYNFYYKSESGGSIRIQIDSDGVVSYIESGCSFA